MTDLRQIPADGSADLAALLLGALADEIADRLAVRLAPRLAEIGERGGRNTAPRESRCDRTQRAIAGGEVEVARDVLWTAGQVASHYGVAVRFIYQHADELGCIRLGGGARPRLRFDPDVVRDNWADVSALVMKAAARRRVNPGSEPRLRRRRAGFELLDFDREP